MARRAVASPPGVAMPRRWGLGPVFACETLLNARRWQVYAGRSALVLVMLVGMVIVWTGQAAPARIRGGRAATFRQMAEVGKGFFYALAGIQVSLVLLAAPAAAAGSICMDRARGTLLHVMVTDLSDAEIVAGKLAARLAPVFGLIACGVPVAALAALLGGIEFGALGGAFVVSLALAVLGCALALAISVRATKTHEVLMAVYMIEGLWLIALPNWWALSRGMGLMAPPAWFQKANPYVLVFAPYNRPGFVGAADFAGFVGVVLALSAGLVVLSIATLRRAVVEQSGRAEVRSRRRLPELGRLVPSWAGPTLDGNPVLWREWHRGRPSRLARRLWAALLLVTWIMAAWGSYDIITEGMPQPRPNALVFGFLIQLLFGMLMLSATAPTTLAEERVRNSLDVLLATPLSTRSIVVAKWWGVFRAALVLGILPLYTGVFLAAVTPDTPTPLAGRFPNPLVPLTVWDRIFAATFCAADFLASCAVIVSLGVALATWVHRLGRAVALSVIAYFLAGIGWIFLVETVMFRLIGPPDRWLRSLLMSLSPIAGPINAIETIGRYAWEPRTLIWVCIGAVILIKAAFAGLLLRATIRTFDRCLGRIPESPSPDRAEKPVALEELATQRHRAVRPRPAGVGGGVSGNLDGVGSAPECPRGPSDRRGPRGRATAILGPDDQGIDCLGQATPILAMAAAPPRLPIRRAQAARPEPGPAAADALPPRRRPRRGRAAGVAGGGRDGPGLLHRAAPPGHRGRAGPRARRRRRGEARAAGGPPPDRRRPRIPRRVERAGRPARPGRSTPGGGRGRRRGRGGRDPQHRAGSRARPGRNDHRASRSSPCPGPKPPSRPSSR